MWQVLFDARRLPRGSWAVGLWCTTQELTSVNSITVGSLAMSEWGVPGAMRSQDPAGRSSCSPSAVKRTPGEDLNYGSAGCLMFGEFFAGVEAEHCDIHPVAPGVGPRRRWHRTGSPLRRRDQRSENGHTGIIVRAKSMRPSRSSRRRPQCRLDSTSAFSEGRHAATPARRWRSPMCPSWACWTCSRWSSLARNREAPLS